MSVPALGVGLEMVERGWVPDAIVRAAIRRICDHHARSLASDGAEESEAFLRQIRGGVIAEETDAANRQHYEVPSEFFLKVLGPHLKYSCCHYENPDGDLGTAEESALRITAERAGLADGQRILELGCGWGSLTLWMAEHYPDARITAVSNSASQRRFIVARAAERGLENLDVRTVDMNDFAPDERFDRIVSVEMFEHMRNWEQLLTRLERHLAPDGTVFLHVFCHREHVYPYETEGPANWMGRHFFTGGLMPSRDLLRRLDIPLEVREEWMWNGTHYQHTSNAWLRNLDRHRDELMPVLAGVYGERDAARWFERWRVFFLACAEMFGLRGGEEWLVGHYRLGRRQHAPRS